MKEYAAFVVKSQDEMDAKFEEMRSVAARRGKMQVQKDLAVEDETTGQDSVTKAASKLAALKKECILLVPNLASPQTKLLIRRCSVSTLYLCSPRVTYVAIRTRINLMCAPENQSHAIHEVSVSLFSNTDWYS